VPFPGADGSRPPLSETGWLSNGQRSPSLAAAEAMGDRPVWAAPLEFGARRHSVFVDVQLWDEDRNGRRTWSCPFLAAVWQALRLGLLRSHGEAVLPARPLPRPWPDRWDDLPPLVGLRPGAPPFSAYRTFSVLAARFLPVEHAVRVVLGQATTARTVAAQIAQRASAEGFAFAPDVLDRVSYMFHD
jgi:hypothetical protein